MLHEMGRVRLSDSPLFSYIVPAGLGKGLDENIITHKREARKSSFYHTNVRLSLLFILACHLSCFHLPDMSVLEMCHGQRYCCLYFMEAETFYSPL